MTYTRLVYHPALDLLGAEPDTDLDFISLQKSGEFYRALGRPAYSAGQSGSVEELARAHALSYVVAVTSGHVANGFGTRGAKELRHILAANGAMIEAVRLAMEDIRPGITCAPVSGFHHAGYSFGGGFCTFNGLLVAIQAYRVRNPGTLRTVLIIDGDAHYGDGTDDIIQRLGLSGIVNMTRRDAEYDLERLLKNVAKYDLVIYQAGADAHEDDPLGEGYLSDSQWRARDDLVFEHCVKSRTPCVWNLAGGYNRTQVPSPVDEGTVSKALALHLSTWRTSELWARQAAELNKPPSGETEPAVE